VSECGLVQLVVDETLREDGIGRRGSAGEQLTSDVDHDGGLVSPHVLTTACVGNGVVQGEGRRGRAVGMARDADVAGQPGYGIDRVPVN
jgi:hypothetical protein